MMLLKYQKDVSANHFNDLTTDKNTSYAVSFDIN